MIVAAAKNGVIGSDNKLLWHLPEDFKFFKKHTTGHPVVMGRKTFQSIGRPLPGRTNIVISSGFSADGAEVVDSLEKAMTRAVEIDRDPFIIGGATIYRMAYPLADRIYLTVVDTELAGDATFDFPESPEWKLSFSEDHPADEKHQYAFEFRIYDRVR